MWDNASSTHQVTSDPIVLSLEGSFPWEWPLCTLWDEASLGHTGCLTVHIAGDLAR